jgi:hypothetical protein
VSSSPRRINSGLRALQAVLVEPDVSRIASPMARDAKRVVMPAADDVNPGKLLDGDGRGLGAPPPLTDVR